MCRRHRALRAAITAAYRRPEPELRRRRCSTRPACRRRTAAAAHALARRLAQALRERKRGGGRAGLVQGLLQEYSLSSQEGVALMCLAEALLRIPDAATRDALIRDKIARRRLASAPRAAARRCSSTPRPGACCVTGKLVVDRTASAACRAR